MMRKTEMAFIDRAVEQADKLPGMMRDGVKAVILEDTGSAIAQIAEAVASEDAEISALHIMAHGAPGAIEFSSGALNAASLSKSREDLSAIGSRMAPDARVNLWVCEAAATEDGRAFLTDMGSMLGKSITASSQKVGNAAKGGTWMLDTLIAVSPLTSAAQASYAGVFTAFNATTGTDNPTLSRQ
ncbi:MAG: DUF4347 domain-containing protein [Hyphomicrobiales bacterium]